jgi:Rieske Fe-S protein
MNRREFIRSLIVTAVLVGSTGAGMIGLGRLIENNQVSLTIQLPNSSQNSANENSNSTSDQSRSAVPTGYSLISSMGQLAGKNYAYFSHPIFGSSILINVSGQWKAFSATCTHRPCTVQFENSVIYCPCHDGIFDPKDGSVEGGPPPTPLPEYPILIQNNSLYVGETRIN